MSGNKRMEQVVSGMIDSKNEETKKLVEPASPATSVRAAVLEKELKGIPTSLLAKVNVNSVVEQIKLFILFSHTEESF